MPSSYWSPSQTTSAWIIAVMAMMSSSVGSPSQVRTSTVPNSGCGRTSHQISRTASMARALTSVIISRWNSAQFSRRYGNPAVGRLSKIFTRHDASPVSSPSKYGELADNASRWGI